MGGTAKERTGGWRVDRQATQISWRRTIIPGSITTLLQHVLPRRALTKAAGRIADADHRHLSNRLIRWFVARYGVDMGEAENPDVGSYASFNDFFTRPLKPSARPIAKADFVSPVDGAISQLGPIEDLHIIQAKGHRFTVPDLLGGDTDLAEGFRNGRFANLYLSPRDYHRIHMPCAGKMEGMRHIPGAFFSVNPATARGIPRLFVRNERVVCVFQSPDHGRFVMVLVGATIVGSMATVWHGVVQPKEGRGISHWTYEDAVIHLARGAEMGRFLLGSTVILLFEPNAIDFTDDWVPARPVRLGEAMGQRPTRPGSTGPE